MTRPRPPRQWPLWRATWLRVVVLLACCISRGDTVISADAVPGSWTEAQSAPVEPEDWATYNYDVRGWRYNARESHISPENAAKLELQWKFPPEGDAGKVGAINATPTVVNGYVYFGTSTYPRFYKLRPNGQIEWVYEMKDLGRRASQRAQRAMGLVPRDGIYSSALVTEDSVYFGDVSGVAYCLDRQTGEERWTVNTKARGFPGAHHANLLMASPIRAAGMVVFAGGAYEHALPARAGYKCCYGRGFVMAVDGQTGDLKWKYDVGPEPEKFDPPIKMRSPWGERTFHYGPSTSSVWSTPSYDPDTQTLYFGTDVHNSPRRPTDDDPRNYTPHSAAVIAVNAQTGEERWVSQVNPDDVWNHTMPSYDPATGYKDQSIGDTPKIYSIQLEGQATRVVGVGCKNGGFYVMHAGTGDIVHHTPIYTGPPSMNPSIDPRTLALPSPIGGLQTGCATDGTRVYTNGIDTIFKGTNSPRISDAPTGGRVTSISMDTKTEHWRHERPKVPWVGGTEQQPLFENCGDPVASGIAVANGCLFFTTFTSNKLVVLNASNGRLLKDFALGPVLAGPSVSRGRVYIGTGNTQFVENDSEAYFPKSTTGTLFCFGLPDNERDTVARQSD